MDSIWVLNLFSFDDHYVPQVREKFLSLRKSTKTGVAAAIEEVSRTSSQKYTQLMLIHQFNQIGFYG